MKRRSFLSALFGAPFLSAAVAAARDAGQPLVFENGELKLATANIGTSIPTELRMVPLRSADGRMVINFEAGTIEIYN